MLLTFVFSNNIDNRVISIKGSTMRNAMHWAAKQLCIKEVNLVFERII